MVVPFSFSRHTFEGPAILLLHEIILKGSNKIQREVEAIHTRLVISKATEIPPKQEALSVQSKLSNICSFLPLNIHEATAIIIFI